MPLFYARYESDASGTVVSTWHLRWAIVNAVIVVAVQLSIVYALQTIRRFSVRALLLTTTVVAIVIAIGMQIPKPRISGYWYVMGVYFLPIVLAVTIGAVVGGKNLIGTVFPALTRTEPIKTNKNLTSRD